MAVENFAPLKAELLICKLERGRKGVGEGSLGTYCWDRGCSLRKFAIKDFRSL